MAPSRWRTSRPAPSTRSDSTIWSCFVRGLILPGTGRGTAARSAVVEGAGCDAEALRPPAAPPPLPGEDLGSEDHRRRVARAGDRGAAGHGDAADQRPRPGGALFDADQ